MKTSRFILRNTQNRNIICANIPAGGFLAPVFDVNVNETLRRDSFCVLQHIIFKTHKKKRGNASANSKTLCFRQFLVRLSGVSPEVVSVHGIPTPLTHPTHMFHVC